MKSITCKEAVHLILKKEEGKISLWQRLILWRHLSICSLCRIFSRQNALINEAMKQRNARQVKLSDQEKQQIIQNILDEKST